MSAQFDTRVTQEDDGIVISVSGEIDIAACERLRDAIEPNMGPQQTIILDLSGVEFMDSSCLRFLVQARGALTADGGSLTLRNPSVAAHRLPRPPGPRLSSTTTPSNGDRSDRQRPVTPTFC